MASINRYQTINDIPQSKGKEVLFKILNSPKADFSKLQQIATDYERKALEIMKTESKENTVPEKKSMYGVWKNEPFYMSPDFDEPLEDFE